MKKIMFNDKYGLTEAVLTGRKTQTRRVIPSGFHKYIKVCEDAGFRPTSLNEYSKYKIGEVIAIAQSYSVLNTLTLVDTFGKEKGWSNKMFVKASLMSHHIKITNVRVERLQDISDADCLAVGIYEAEKDAIGKWVIRYGFDDIKNPYGHWFKTPKEAYASLIDKVGKKGTWDSNPWVFVYDFKLID